MCVIQDLVSKHAQGKHYAYLWDYSATLILRQILPRLVPLTVIEVGRKRERECFTAKNHIGIYLTNTDTDMFASPNKIKISAISVSAWISALANIG